MDIKDSIDTAICDICTAKYLQCAICYSQNLKFNPPNSTNMPSIMGQWNMSCQDCPNGSNDKQISGKKQSICKNCIKNYTCKTEHCHKIVKNACVHCKATIEHCPNHHITGNAPSTLCNRCTIRFCNSCNSRTQDPTFACIKCHNQQCQTCFDYKDQITPIAVLQYTCKQCNSPDPENLDKAESDNNISQNQSDCHSKNSPILYSVSLETCLESIPCQHYCEILYLLNSNSISDNKYPSGVLVKRVLRATNIEDLLKNNKYHPNLVSQMDDIKNHFGFDNCFIHNKKLDL